MNQLEIRHLYDSVFMANILKTGNETSGNAGIMAVNGQFPFNLAVSMRLFDGFDVIDKFGENPEIDTGTSEDVWEGGGTYVYDAFGTAPILYLSGDNVLDVDMPIKITGLDIDGNEVEQVLSMNGQTVVNLTTPLWRVYRMENEGDEGESLIGKAYCHTDPSPINGVPLPANVRALINDGNNQSLMALYTIPKGKVGFLFRGEFGTSRAQATGAAECAYYSRRLGKLFKLKKRIDVANSGLSTYQDLRSFPDIIPALTDIKLRVESVSANGMGVVGTFDILLVDENFLSSDLLLAINNNNQ